MKKIGIITITSGNNYGNRLQNYALTHVLEENGYYCETIHNNDKIKFKSKIKNIIKRLFFYKKYKYTNMRNNNFKAFNNKYIRFSNKNVNNKNSKNIENDYDYFICGSDQIWNLNYPENGYINFLGFCDSNKKIAYAASFGSSIIPNNYNKNIYKWLLDFKKISVRENTGIDVIKKITNNKKSAEVVLDPTLLLSPNEWMKLEKKPDFKVPSKYILIYFLGNISDISKKSIEKYASDNNLSIINILDKNSKFYTCGPSEFLYLERNASIIFTDSYHSCIFAFLFNISFVIFTREEKGLVDMNSRIETLLTNFKLKNREYNGKCITKDNLLHDYSDAYKVLRQEREKSYEFLKNTLDIKDCE